MTFSPFRESPIWSTIVRQTWPKAKKRPESTPASFLYDGPTSSIPITTAMTNIPGWEKPVPALSKAYIHHVGAIDMKRPQSNWMAIAMKKTLFRPILKRYRKTWPSKIIQQTLVLSTTMTAMTPNQLYFCDKANIQFKRTPPFFHSPTSPILCF